MTTAYNLGKEICKTLFRAGYTAYFAGGWVRDFLLHRTDDAVSKESEEIDIATSASPDIIQKLFQKTIPVGIAFGVVIVVLKQVHFEVTTFRKDHPYADGRHPDGVDFSTAEKDAQRRDFTINGMFYDPLTETLLDYVEGEKDLHNKVVRAIGDPHLRFTEDRLRMIRAIRFSARLGFTLESQTACAIAHLAHTLLPAVSMERIWQEFNKMAAYPHLDLALKKMHQLGLLSTIFPVLKETAEEEIERRVAPFIDFPKETPTIIFLMELFPHASLEEKIELCFYLKTPVIDRKWVEFFDHAHHLLAQKENAPHLWAHFYAHPFSSLFVEIEGAKQLSPQRLLFCESHAQRREQLLAHILRIQQKTPLVTAHHLLQKGIVPGKKMGALLRKAEEIAIDYNLHSADEVLRHLESN